MNCGRRTQILVWVVMVTQVAVATAQQPARPARPKTASPGSVSPLQPTDRLAVDPNVGSRETLKQNLKDVCKQMAETMQAATALEAEHDGSALSAIKPNLIKLQFLSHLADALPLAVRTIEDYRIDLRMQIDSKAAEFRRLEACKRLTEANKERLIEAILDGEQNGESAVTIDAQKRILQQRLDQLDAQQMAAERCRSIGQRYLEEVERLTTLDEILDGLAADKAVYAERLLEAIDRQAYLTVSDDVSSGIQDLNEMIAALSANQGDLGPFGDSDDANEADPGTLKAELAALQEAVRPKNATRVDEVLKQAREARGQSAKVEQSSPSDINGEPASPSNEPAQ